MHFSEYRITPQIKQNLEIMGFKRPTDIQYKCIPTILKGEDLLAIAQTGTGKTAAFAIPVAHRLLDRKRAMRYTGIRCVVMVPTRELALQITEVFDKIGQNTRLKTLCLFGGVDQDPQIARLDGGVDILVTTPGRMFDLHHQGHINLSKAEFLILDEADRMLDMGFLKDIQDAVSLLPNNRQTLFFSATINDRIKKLAYSLVSRNAVRIQISPKDPVSKNVRHSVAFIAMDDKRFFLERLVKENPEAKMLVFVRTKVRAERVHAALGRVGIDAETIHGDKEQHARMETLARFRTGEIKLLIATDVSARGIDVPDVEFVVNYDLPDVAENYVHRVGRTGRGERMGDAISFCSIEEKPLLEAIEAFIGKPITQTNIDKGEYQYTLRMTEDVGDKWRDVMREVEEAEKYFSKKKKKG
ncbi:MAG: DEAD/DEAH box helicase [Saprospiraceae bacterium]|nr:DEAD/DEAH box helicase [Saprospiraceae bacterium]